MTPTMLRIIAIRYNIMRGIRGQGVEEDENEIADEGYQEQLCCLINEAARNWPRTLIDRAQACRELVESAVNQGCFIGNQASAATKLMWFMRPNGWTMFDKFAANGLDIPAGLPALQRMPRFYETLKNLEISKTWNKMQLKINTTFLRKMPAPRIIDSVLISIGSDGAREHLKSTAKYAMALLPKSIAVDIHNLSEDLQNEYGAELAEKLPAK